MVKIMLVDDDQEFINLTKLWNLDNAELTTFTDPVIALEKVPLICPDIIISDVMMPGVHGIQFVKIAKSIFKSSHLIIISANSKKQVTKDVGSLGELKFFRKPLEKDFYNYSDELIEKIVEEKKNEPNKKVDPQKTESQVVSTKLSSSDIKTKVRYLDKIAKHYKEYHDFMYEMVLKEASLYGKEGSAGHCDQLERNLRTAMDLVFDEKEHKEVYSGLSNKYHSWEDQVLGNVDKFIIAENVVCREPFYPNIDSLDKQFLITSFSSKFDEDNNLEFKINNEIPKKEVPFEYRSKVGKIVYFTGIYRHLKRIEKDAAKIHINKYWHSMSRIKIKSGLEVVFTFNKIQIHDNYFVDKLVLINDKYAMDNVNYYFQDEKIQFEKYIRFNLDAIPEKTLICVNKSKIVMKYKDDAISATLDGKKIDIPAEQEIDDSINRGFQVHKSYRTFAKVSIEYIYEKVLQKLIDETST